MQNKLIDSNSIKQLIEGNEEVFKFRIREKALSGHEAATISTGTLRIIAMLTANYALDIDRKSVV